MSVCNFKLKSFLLNDMKVYKVLRSILSVLRSKRNLKKNVCLFICLFRLISGTAGSILTGLSLQIADVIMSHLGVIFFRLALPHLLPVVVKVQ